MSNRCTVFAIQSLTVTLSIAIGMSGHDHLHAAGFQVTPTTDSSLRLLGGSGVIGNELGDMYYNAAGLSLVDQRGCEFSTSVVAVEKQFRNENSNLTIVSGSDQVVVPLSSPGDDASDDTGSPSSLFCAQPLAGHNKVRIGFGIATPWGLSTTYDDDWIGRYHTIRSELVAIDVNPNISWQSSDTVALGLGVSFQSADVKLSRALFQGLGVADGSIDVRGDDNDIGYNVGLMYTPKPDMRFGISYRSKLDYKLKGKAHIRGTPIDGDYDAEAPLTIPEYVHLSAYKEFSDITLALGARWTRWERFKEINIKVAGFPDDVTPQNWKNAWTFGAALGYRFSRMTATVGIGYDQSPVDSAEFRIPSLPDSRRSHLALGLQGQFGSTNTTWQLGFNRIFVGDTPIRATRPLSADPIVVDRLIGEFEGKDVNKVTLRISGSF